MLRVILPSTTRKGASMNSVLLMSLRRRDMFRAMLGAAIATSATVPVQATPTELTGSRNKRKARYQPQAPEVKNFYRVARYPAQ
jgi:hypothetical protein